MKIRLKIDNTQSAKAHVLWAVLFAFLAGGYYGAREPEWATAFAAISAFDIYTAFKKIDYNSVDEKKD